ncbi:hypothetical protein [Saccharopolyspora gregorii]|uniref:hypothetical protein n=1 Tax=Saccharopolyspora gregorii TaxID=33914 RepID=UPI0021ACDDD9|nr:hypothetical protein [Saccharopolyspora gregorii]
MAALITTMHDLITATKALKAARHAPASPQEAKEAFRDSIDVGINLNRFADTLHKRVDRVLDDPEVEMTSQQRDAYQDLREQLHQLVRGCIYLTGGFYRVDKALHQLSATTQRSGHRF